MSFLDNFQQIARGVVEAPTIILFASLIVFFLFANVIAVGQKKAA
jgi:hypothetical protein